MMSSNSLKKETTEGNRYETKEPCRNRYIRGIGRTYYTGTSVENKLKGSVYLKKAISFPGWRTILCWPKCTLFERSLFAVIFPDVSPATNPLAYIVSSRGEFWNTFKLISLVSLILPAICSYNGTAFASILSLIVTRNEDIKWEKIDNKVLYV